MQCPRISLDSNFRWWTSPIKLLCQVLKNQKSPPSSSIWSLLKYPLNSPFRSPSKFPMKILLKTHWISQTNKLKIFSLNSSLVTTEGKLEQSTASFWSNLRHIYSQISQLWVSTKVNNLLDTLWRNFPWSCTIRKISCKGRGDEQIKSPESKFY